MKSKFNNLNIISIIPTYNEVTNIHSLIEQLFSLKITLDVLIVDDNSPDGTSQEVAKLQDTYSHLYLITRKNKRGLGSAYKKGFTYALEKGYDVIIQMDADLSHSPSDIPQMVNLLDEYAFVIGSRYVKGGGIAQWPLKRLLLSKAANVFSKSVLCIAIKDSTSGFKCMRRQVLERIEYNTISSRGYAFQIEMVFRACLKKIMMTEYPIVFKGRKNDRSKMSLSIALEAFVKVLFLCCKRFNYLFFKK
ncbi:MAG: polyprenol monophosphomannose synthase [Candidatus Omnitrophica bacterium]|nr:polyprenol monophosphomannose synthase [Candidatus Omnitrophota bacterium]